MYEGSVRELKDELRTALTGEPEPYTPQHKACDMVFVPVKIHSRSLHSAEFEIVEREACIKTVSFDGSTYEMTLVGSGDLTTKYGTREVDQYMRERNASPEKNAQPKLIAAE